MPKPILQALLLADHVYQDKATGKKVIAGTFNQLNLSKIKPAPQEPPQASGPRQLSPAEVTRLGSPTVFISLTDVRGPIELELRYVDLADNGVLLRARFPIQSDDPLKTVEAIVPMPPLPAPHPGVYALELVYNEEPLGALRITAVEAPEA
ncbi:MAG: hypothetical protein ACUVUC_01270 [Thermoguttaceae bacterium]